MPNSKVEWVIVGACPNCGETLEADRIMPVGTRHVATKKEKCK